MQSRPTAYHLFTSLPITPNNQVIEPHWHALREALTRPAEKGVAHIDDVIRRHQEFQDTCT